ncbi:hypothetical protein E2C01_025005 [Portunus trituberculatus]|uniref:Uncharacterized protein n=1 Tax=Portunus trituberculatus TaxID=210409 RepID=A0A5B7EDY0_PORTR|nr:hypothetical protein [Portunus trituberculatus]
MTHILCMELSIFLSSQQLCAHLLQLLPGITQLTAQLRFTSCSSSRSLLASLRPADSAKWPSSSSRAKACSYRKGHGNKSKKVYFKISPLRGLTCVCLASITAWLSVNSISSFSTVLSRVRTLVMPARACT